MGLGKKITSIDLSRKLNPTRMRTYTMFNLQSDIPNPREEIVYDIIYKDVDENIKSVKNSIYRNLYSGWF